MFQAELGVAEFTLFSKKKRSVFAVLQKIPIVYGKK